MKTSYFANSFFRNFNKDYKGGVSIALQTPSWYTTGVVYEKLYPTPYLLTIKDKPAEYYPIYKKEVLDKLDVHEAWKELCELTAPLEPILLCYEKDLYSCHRSIVLEWFKEAGYEINELLIKNKGDE
jgi:hypothetical protein